MKTKLMKWSLLGMVVASFSAHGQLIRCIPLDKEGKPEKLGMMFEVVTNRAELEQSSRGAFLEMIDVEGHFPRLLSHYRHQAHKEKGKVVASDFEFTDATPIAWEKIPKAQCWGTKSVVKVTDIKLKPAKDKAAPAEYLAQYQVVPEPEKRPGVESCSFPKFKIEGAKPVVCGVAKLTVP